MTTLVLNLSTQMAVRLAKATEILELPSHEDAALKGVGLFLDSILGAVRGRPPMSEDRRRQVQANRKREASRRAKGGSKVQKPSSPNHSRLSLTRARIQKVP